MTQLQTILLAFIQGVTELYPVSSLAHAVIFPKIMGWHINQDAALFLPFVVALHLGTALAALLFFWRDWVEMGLCVIGVGTKSTVQYHRALLGHIIIATIPAVILALIFQSFIGHFFALPIMAALFLVVNGFILFFGERIRRHNHRKAVQRNLHTMNWVDSLIIGLVQALALIPGISRSGITIVAGLTRGLHHEQSAKFSFLIATPLILGAALLELPKLVHQHYSIMSHQALLGGVVAFVTSLIALYTLMRYFHRHDVKSLDPFAYYCWVAGGLSALLLFLNIV